MIPLRDENPTRRFPLMTVGLIVANLAIFFADTLQRVTVLLPTANGTDVQEVVGKFSLFYAMIPAHVMGHAESVSALPGWTTILTSMFLHANWLHVGGNMLYLWIFGNNIEDVLGRGRFILFYLLCGVGAAALHIASDPNSLIPTVGASGAVAGLMGAYLLLYPRARILSIVPLGFFSTLLEVPAIAVIGFWFVLQIFNSQLLGSGGQLTQGGGVAYLAHVGGFLTGMLLITLLGGRKLVPTEEALTDS